MRKFNHPNTAKNKLETFQPSDDTQIYTQPQAKKSSFSPMMVGVALGLVGMVWLFASSSNQKYQERCYEGVSATGEKIVNCTTYRDNSLYSHTSYPYVFWLNSRGNYTNNNGVYERVWSVKNNYSSSYSNGGTTTKKTSLGSSGKSYGGSSG